MLLKKKILGGINDFFPIQNGFQQYLQHVDPDFQVMSNQEILIQVQKAE